MKQLVRGYKRKPYTYKAHGKTVRVPETNVPKFKRKVRGKGKVMKRRIFKYKPRKRKVDQFGQFS